MYLNFKLFFVVTSIVMARVQAEPVWKREYLVEYRFVQGVWVALLEISPAAASDQESITSEYHPLLVTDVSYTSWNKNVYSNRSFWMYQQEGLPFVWPGVDRTSILWFPNSIMSPCCTRTSARAPLLAAMTVWQYGSRFFSCPLAVTWSECMWVFTGYSKQLNKLIFFLLS